MQEDKKLEFPVITKPMPPGKTLNMEDYLRFVIFNLKNTVDLERVREVKKAEAVNFPFTLK